MKKRVSLNALAVAVVLSVLTLGGCSEPPAAGTNPDSGVIPVKLAPAVQAPAFDEVPVSGLLGSEKEARLSFKTPGIVQTIAVAEGDRVVAGQLLALLNPTEIRAQADQAREAEAKARRDLVRTKEIYEAGVATREQFENAQTAADLARRSLEIAVYAETTAEIRAPGPGTVVRKLLNEGELAAPGVPVLEFSGAGPGDWVLKCGVSDQVWVRVHKGDPASLEIDAYPGQVFSGTVDQLAQAVDPRTGLYQVEVRLEPRGAALASGLFARGAIRVPSREPKWSVPVDALVDGQGAGARVFVSRGGKAEAREVKVLEFGPSAVLVAADFGPGALVIVAGAAYLQDGSTIRAAD